MYCIYILSSIIGSDHGIKAQGEGWLLTVALINGSNLPAVDSSGFCDPYVVFTCNGKTRTSSIKFQQSNPQWNGEADTILICVLSELPVSIFHMSKNV